MNTTADDQPTAPTYVVVTATLFYAAIFMVGILGNILVVTVVGCSRQMKTAVNIYLVNLCVADILVLGICMPTALVEIFTMEAWHFGSFMCKMVPFLENTVANASVLTILAISIERYRVVCNPLKGIEEDFTKVAKIVAVIWIISALASAPCLAIAVYRLSQLVDGTPIMVCRNPIILPWQRVYVTLLSLLFFGIPFVLLFVLNIHLCCILVNTRLTTDHFGNLQGRSDFMNRKRLQNQVINIITSIVIIFFVCHLPLRIVGLWFTFEDKYVIYSLGLEKYLNILYFTRIMFYMNHALNPIVYNMVSTKFRTALRLLFFRHQRSGRTQGSRMRTMNGKDGHSCYYYGTPAKRNLLTPLTKRETFKNDSGTDKYTEMALPQESSSLSKDYEADVITDDQHLEITYHANKKGLVSSVSYKNRLSSMS